MKNKKLIVINGITRGGTNVLWNVIQSHPAVCAAIRETSDLFTPGILGFLRPVAMRAVGSEFLLQPTVTKIAGPMIDARFFNSKMRNFTDPNNRYKYEGVEYTREEVAEGILCLKSVNRDNFMNPLLAKMYGEENVYFVGITRNGYALCQSWVSRGESAARAGKRYKVYIERMIEDGERYPNHTMVKFEDLLSDPFSVAEHVFEFAGLDPVRLEKLRLKPKKIMSKDGTRQTPFGEVKAKYWFTRETVGQILVKDIGKIQTNALVDEDRKAFEASAKPVLDYLGYV